MKFKVQFVSVFNLRLLESQKTMKKPNQYRIFAQCKKNIETSQFEFVALMASLMSVVALAIDALCRLWILWGDYWDYRSRG
jgi:hypothetical protein